MNLKPNNICILGDVMLDMYQYVSPVKISSEAPVLVTKSEYCLYYPGGAANVAMNCHALGAIPYLIAPIGKDDTGDALKSTLSNKNISTDYLLEFNNFITIEKRRIVNNSHQQILRIDKEEYKNYILSQEQINLFGENLENLSKFCNTLVISDYNKGTAILAERAIEIFKSKNKFVVVNAKPENITCYNFADLISLNKEEYSCITSEIKTSFLVTLGKDGMIYHSITGENLKIPAESVDVADVCGAGDTVISTIAVAGEVSIDILKQASVNAGKVVGKHGTATP